jgi:serine/threonine protein kinase
MIDPDLGSLFELKPGTTLPATISLFGRYRASRVLGIGGTSVVLEAHDEVLGRLVALKIWNPRLAARYDWGERVDRYFGDEHEFFRQEARSLASIAHPALCAVHDFAIAPNGIPWMALEYIPGNTLRTKIEEWRNSDTDWKLSDILDIFQQLVDAVAFLHSLSLCQLDLKPENVLLDGGRVRLIDFASSLERPSRGYEIQGARYGTPGYIAPEVIVRRRAREEPIVTPAADVFSLGIILLEMLSLENPLATQALQRAAYEALGIVEREIYLDYRTAALLPDFSEQLASWATAYVQGLRSIDLSDRRYVRLADTQPELVQLLRMSVSEEPKARPPDGQAVLAQLVSIRIKPATLGPVFISHAHQDKLSFVDAFVKALIARHVSVWYDSYDIRVGEPFWDRIFRALERARFVVVVLSRNVLSSAGVLEELRYAHLDNLDRVKVLPILIDDTAFESLPPSLRSRRILRFPSTAGEIEFSSSVDEFVRQMRELADEKVS